MIQSGEGGKVWICGCGNEAHYHQVWEDMNLFMCEECLMAFER